MLAKTQIDVLLNGQATSEVERKAKRRLQYNLKHALHDDRASQAIREYLEDPTANAAVLIYSEELQKNFSFKRASLARDLDVASSSFHIPSRAVDLNFSQLAMDGLNSKLAALQRTAHGSDFDGFFVAAPMTNIAAVDKVTEAEFARLIELGFRDEDPNAVVEEIKAHIQSALPPDRNWNPDVKLVFADGNLTEKLAKGFARLQTNNARVEAHLTKVQRGAPLGRLYEASHGAFSAAAKLWNGLFLGLRESVDGFSIKMPDGIEYGLQLRAPSETQLRRQAANENTEADDGDEPANSKG